MTRNAVLLLFCYILLAVRKDFPKIEDAWSNLHSILINVPNELATLLRETDKDTTIPWTNDNVLAST